MPIPLADRRGQLAVPRAETGKAISPAENIEQIGQIGANTLRLMSRATDNLSKALIAQKRQEEQMSAQDALTEYLAGREKLDSVRNSLTLENAVNFEDKYYQEAQKMHTEFLNKINQLQYADIRERARGQANNTNIQGAAQAENFFWKQKEAVADNHTAALVDVTTRDVVNGVNSNPGMEEYNKANIAQGYAFVLDTMKNRLMQKGYRDGSEEMELAMAQQKDRYFATVLEEISHRPDNGLAMAHSMGLAFKKQMTPEQWNRSMRPISANYLSEELAKDPTRFFKQGDYLNGEINFKEAAKYSAGLDDAERRAYLKAFQQKANSGNSTEKAAKDTAFSREFRIRQGEWLAGSIGDSLGLISGEKELDKLSKEQKQTISKQLLNNVNVLNLADQMELWARAIDGPIYAYVLQDGQTGYASTLEEGKKKYGDVAGVACELTEEDKTFMRSRMSVLYRFLADNPDLVTKGLRRTMFEGKKPTVREVLMGAAIVQADKVSRKDRWWEPINVFGVFGQAPVQQKNYQVIPDLFRAARTAAGNNGNMIFDDLPTREQERAFQTLAAAIERNTGKEYASLFGSDAMNTSLRDQTGAAAFARDIWGVNGDSGTPSFLRSFGAMGTAAGLAAIYYGVGALNRANANMLEGERLRFANQVAKVNSPDLKR